MHQSIDLVKFTSKKIIIHIYSERVDIVLKNGRTISKPNHADSITIKVNPNNYTLSYRIYVHRDNVRLKVNDFKGQYLSILGKPLNRLFIEHINARYVKLGNVKNGFHIDGYINVKKMVCNYVGEVFIDTWYDKDTPSINQLEMKYCEHLNTMGVIGKIISKYIGGYLLKRVDINKMDIDFLPQDMEFKRCLKLSDEKEKELISKFKESDCILNKIMLIGV